ncbi:MAG TPA: ABC transporter permease subunit [Planctomycetota bacterium]|nr:ABC transporter permease subunit [Planctomycetota bacterium]
MILRRVLIIARKEFTDVLRDRRTLIFMLLLPIVVIPALLMIITSFAKSQIKERESRVLTYAVQPQGKVLLQTLAHRWMNDNMAAFAAASARLGIEAFGGLDDLSKVATRVQALEDAGDGKGGVSEQAVVAWVGAWRDLNDEQQQMLRDGGAVSRFLDQTAWVSFDKLPPSGPLPQGVTVPPDLPGGLGQERIAASITSREKAVHAAIDVPAGDIDQWLNVEPQSAVSLPLTILYDGSQSLSREANDRFEGFVDALNRSEVRARLTAVQFGRDFVKPVAVKEANIASKGREAQAFIGGMLPYLIILFCFFGAFYPSLDLTAGEKERFTLETLLLAPVSRVEIAAGKFLVVFAAAVTAAVLTTASLAFTFTHGILPEGATAAFDLHFEVPAVLLTASLLVPVAALFASVLLTVALCARSFKEAQSYATPLQFLIILPAMTALMPDLQTELKWAWVPLMNVSLLMRELLKGNYLWDFYAITLVSMFLLSGLTLWIASRVFRRESVLLRT